MATAADIRCGICDARHTSKTADYWCQECGEGLCSECQKSYHAVSKGTRNHDVIDIASYTKLPSFILELTKHCTEHNMEFQHYCPRHDAVGCPVCVSTTHKKCTDLIALSEVIKTSKSSTLLESIQDSLQVLKSNIQNIILDRQQNLTRLQEERQNFIDEIERVRNKINSHLNTLVEKVISTLQAIEENATQNVNQLLEEFQKKTETIEELERNTLAVKQYASDMQTFFATKAINTEVLNEESHIKSLFRDGSLDELTLKCNIDDRISDILSSLTTFGSVTLETGSPSISLRVGRSKQAQIMSVFQSPSHIYGIKLTLLARITIPESLEGNIHGSIICPNGKLMFTNYEHRTLTILNKNGTQENKMNIPSDPNDITMINDKTVAVATNTGIYFVDTDTKHAKSFVKTNNRCDGITCYNDELLWCERGKDLQTISVFGNNITLLRQQNPSYDFCYVTAYNDKIYQTNYRTMSVTCSKTHGEKIWEFSDDSMHSGPIGVAVDNNSNVYVTTYQSNSVVVISPDGKQSRTILLPGDGMKNPWGIHFDRINENILVTNSKGPAFLYHVG